MDFTSVLWAAIRQRLQAPEANELQVVDLSTGTSHSHRQLLQRVEELSTSVVQLLQPHRQPSAPAAGPAPTEAAAEAAAATAPPQHTSTPHAPPQPGPVSQWPGSDCKLHEHLQHRTAGSSQHMPSSPAEPAAHASTPVLVHPPCVGVYARPSFDYVSIALAALAAGCAFVPLDPSWPTHRAHYTASHAHCALVLMDSTLAAPPPACSGAIGDVVHGDDGMAAADKSSDAAGVVHADKAAGKFRDWTPAAVSCRSSHVHWLSCEQLLKVISQVTDTQQAAVPGAGVSGAGMQAQQPAAQQACAAARPQPAAASFTPTSGADGHPDVSAQHLPLPYACVLYTSGSSGRARPAGVPLTEHALLSRMEWMQRIFPLHGAQGGSCNPGDVMPQQHSQGQQQQRASHARVCFSTAVSFVDHLWQVLAPLLYGADMIIPAAGWHLVPTHFVKDVLWRHQVTHWVSVPSVLRLMQPHLQHATKDAHFTHSAGGDDIPTGMLMPMHAPHSCKAAGAAMHWPAASQACNDHWQEAISMEGGAGKLPGSELHALIHEVALRCVVSSGEPLPWALAKRLVASLPSDAILLNLYGPTEVTADCTCFNVSAALSRRQQAAKQHQQHQQGVQVDLGAGFQSTAHCKGVFVPAGWPIDGARVTVAANASTPGTISSIQLGTAGMHPDALAAMDSHAHVAAACSGTQACTNVEAELAAIGEVCVAGLCVAPGYMHDAVATAQSFVTGSDTVSCGDGRDGSWMYRTGDMGRLDETGCLHVLGRATRSLKLGGVRVGMGEVEALLMEHGSVAEAAVHIWAMHAEDDDQAGACIDAGMGTDEGSDDVPVRLHMAAYIVLKAPQHEQHVRQLQQDTISAHHPYDLATLHEQTQQMHKHEVGTVFPTTPIEKGLGEVLAAWLSCWLPAAALPHSYSLLPALPRSPAGKVLWSQLPPPLAVAKLQAAAAAAAPAAAAPAGQSMGSLLPRTATPAEMPGPTATPWLVSVPSKAEEAEGTELSDSGGQTSVVKRPTAQTATPSAGTRVVPLGDMQHAVGGGTLEGINTPVSFHRPPACNEAAIMHAIACTLGTAFACSLEPSDDIFAHGATSLDAVALAHALCVDVRLVLSHASVRQLSAVLSAGVSGDDASNAAGKRRRSSNGARALMKQSLWVGEPSNKQARMSSFLDAAPGSDQKEGSFQQAQSSMPGPDILQPPADPVLSSEEQLQGQGPLQGLTLASWAAALTCPFGHAVVLSGAGGVMQCRRLHGQDAWQLDAPAREGHQGTSPLQGLAVAEAQEAVAATAPQSVMYQHQPHPGVPRMQRAWRHKLGRCVDAPPMVIAIWTSPEEQPSSKSSGVDHGSGSSIGIGTAHDLHSAISSSRNPLADERQLHIAVLACSHDGDVVCMCACSGTMLWRAVLPGRADAGMAVCHSMRYVAVACSDGRLHCVDLANGSVPFAVDCCRSPLSDRLPSMLPPALALGPAAVDSRGQVAAPSAVDANASAAIVSWGNGFPRQGTSAPRQGTQAVSSSGDLKAPPMADPWGSGVWVSSHARLVSLVQPASGTRLAMYELEAASSTALAFSARHRLAFASTLQGTVHALRVNTSLADAATLRTRLTYQDADTSHTMRHGQSDSATSGAVHAEAGRVLIAADKGGAVVLECVWRIQLSRNGRTMPIFSTPVVVEDVHADTSGLLVVSSVDGRLHGLSLSGGDKVWCTQLEGHTFAALALMQPQTPGALVHAHAQVHHRTSKCSTQPAAAAAAAAAPPPPPPPAAAAGDTVFPAHHPSSSSCGSRTGPQALVLACTHAGLLYGVCSSNGQLLWCVRVADGRISAAPAPCIQLCMPSPRLPSSHMLRRVIGQHAVVPGRIHVGDDTALAKERIQHSMGRIIRHTGLILCCPASGKARVLRVQQVSAGADAASPAGAVIHAAGAEPSGRSTRPETKWQCVDVTGCSMPGEVFSSPVLLALGPATLQCPTECTAAADTHGADQAAAAACGGAVGAAAGGGHGLSAIAAATTAVGTAASLDGFTTAGCMEAREDARHLDICNSMLGIVCCRDDHVYCMRIQ